LPPWGENLPRRCNRKSTASANKLRDTSTCILLPGNWYPVPGYLIPGTRYKWSVLVSLPHQAQKRKTFHWFTTQCEHLNKVQTSTWNKQIASTFAMSKSKGTLYYLRNCTRTVMPPTIGPGLEFVEHSQSALCCGIYPTGIQLTLSFNCPPGFPCNCGGWP
jgi:hypothetical protein